MTGRKRIVLTEDNIKQLKDPMVSNLKLSKHIGCTTTAIGYWRNKMGMNRMDALKLLYADEIVGRFKNGDTIDVIRKIFSAPSSFVVGVLRERGVIQRKKYTDKHKVEYEHFDYKRALDAEIKVSSGYLELDESEYRQWTAESRMGQFYMINIQGHPLEGEFIKGKVTWEEMRMYRDDAMDNNGEDN